MITTFEQLEQLVRACNLTHWVVSRNDNYRFGGEGGEANNSKVVDSDFYGPDLDQQLAMTKTVLERCPGRLYFYGWADRKKSGAICEELIFNNAAVQGVGAFGLGFAAPAPAQLPMIDRDEMKRQIMIELENERYKQEKADFIKERDEFEKEKAGAIGILLQHAKPILSALAGRNVTQRVGVLDGGDDALDEHIKAQQAQEEEQEEDSPFTDEEAEELMTLLADFKAIEPEYLVMIRRVVAMAKTKDPMYDYAKKFLTGNNNAI